MIESAVGILIGFLLGMNLDAGFEKLGGETAIILALALCDELAGLLKGTEHALVRGLVSKVVFCGAALWIENMTGVLLGPLVIVILMLSLYRRITVPEKTAAGVK